MPGDQHSHLVKEGVNLHVRAQLAAAISDQIAKNGWSQAEAAQRLGVQQPRISYLVSGQIERFSVDALLNLATLAGLRVEVSVKPH
jgi:predicted XRE-type DNA-binding protein